MLVAIRLRGSVKIPQEIDDTLALLRLRRKMHAVLLADNPSINGMLQKVKDWTTFGTISDELLQQLVVKRGRKTGNKRLATEEVSQIISEFKAGSRPDIKPVFRLTPPSGGFKHSIKQAWPNGELGDRGEKINELLKRMI